jgi:hypothetical protein
MMWLALLMFCIIARIPAVPASKAMLSTGTKPRPKETSEALDAVKQIHSSFTELALVAIQAFISLASRGPAALAAASSGSIPLGLEASKVIVPDIGASNCLGPKGNGVSLGEGGEGGPGPPGGREDKQSVLSEGRDNMGNYEEDRASWT